MLLRMGKVAKVEQLKCNIALDTEFKSQVRAGSLLDRIEKCAEKADLLYFPPAPLPAETQDRLAEGQPTSVQPGHASTAASAVMSEPLQSTGVSIANVESGDESASSGAKVLFDSTKTPQSDAYPETQLDEHGDEAYLGPLCAVIQRHRASFLQTENNKQDAQLAEFEKRQGAVQDAMRERGEQALEGLRSRAAAEAQALKAFETHREEAISSLFDALDVKQRGVLEAWELKLILILILPLT